MVGRIAVMAAALLWPASSFAEVTFDGGSSGGSSSNPIDAGVLGRIHDRSGETLKPNEILEALERSMHEIHAKVKDGVVSIDVHVTTEEQLAKASRNSPYFLSNSGGSGFVVDAPSGLIVTNAHVVSPVGRAGRRYDKDEVTISGKDVLGKDYEDKTQLLATNHVQRASIVVIFDNGDLMPGKLLDFDPDQDLALLTVSPVGGGPLQALSLGESSKLQVGDYVVAAGAPQGLSGSYTYGQISFVDRVLRNGRHFIQHDAPCNHGNSGGPLFDIRGQVVGVNSNIAKEGAESLCLAIPIDIVKAKIGQYAQTRRIHTPLTGMQLADSDKGGVMVKDLWPDSPAARAGVIRGDRIVEVDGIEFSGAEIKTAVDAFADLIASKAPGTPIKLSVLRGLDKQRLVLELIPD